MIRKATVEDLGRLIELGREYHNSTFLKDLADYDDESSGMLFLSYIEDPQRIVLVADDGDVNGFFMAVMVPLYFNLLVMASQQIAWYVTPGKRGKDSIKLFDAWEEWAVSNGAKFFSVGSQPDKAMKRLMRSRDYKELECMYVKGGH